MRETGGRADFAKVMRGNGTPPLRAGQNAIMKSSRHKSASTILAAGLGIILLLLAGCASQIPVVIKLSPQPDIGLAEVQDDIAPFEDQYVRWGGEIISVENGADSTLIEILANPLKSYGRPNPDNAYQGRFMARIGGFLDPEHYKKGRKLTVYGKIADMISGQIDEHPYNYPLVNAGAHYLWPEHRDHRYHYPPYPYPYYYPYYGPYYRHYFGFYHLH